MTKYYVNNSPQKNGDHEVHMKGCSWLEKIDDKTYLGNFSICLCAMEKAKLTYPETTVGCKHCCLNDDKKQPASPLTNELNEVQDKLACHLPKGDVT